MKAIAHSDSGLEATLKRWPRFPAMRAATRDFARPTRWLIRDLAGVTASCWWDALTGSGSSWSGSSGRA